MIRANQTIGEIARREPEAIHVFHSLGIHYCCQGQQTIEEAAKSAGISSESLLKGLLQSTQSTVDSSARRVDPILETLMLHLVQSRKTVVQSDLPRITALVPSVAQCDERKYPHALEVTILAEALAREVEAHIFAEVSTLFPMIHNIEVAYIGVHTAPVQVKKFRHTVGKMTHEHEDIGYLLSSIYRLTGGYQPGSSLDSPYAALCRELKALDRELREEVHLENNVLFNRALQFSRNLWPAPGAA